MIQTFASTTATALLTLELYSKKTKKAIAAILTFKDCTKLKDFGMSYFTFEASAEILELSSLELSLSSYLMKSLC